jgi:diacylglycerol kinase family enzyme
VSFHFRGLRVWRSGFVRRRIKVAMDGEILWLRTPLEFRVAPRPLYLIKPVR